MSLRQACARWYPAYPARSVRRRPPRRFGTLEVDLTGLVAAEFPPLGVAEIPDGRVFGTEGWAYAPDGTLLPEASWYGAAGDEMRIRRRFPGCRSVKGVCLSLATDFARRNWGHFLLDLVPRIHLFHRAGFHWDDVDAVYLTRPPNRDGWRLLERAGVPPEKCVWAKRGRFLRADRLLVTSFPGVRRNYPPWTAEYLRSLRGEAPGRPWRRLYLPRDRRRPRHEARLLEGSGLERYRFDGDQFRDFAQAEWVVGAHGAALASVVFCEPGTRVLELVPTGHVYPYFYTLCDSASLAYGYLAGESLGEPAGDFHVEEGAFRSALGAL